MFIKKADQQFNEPIFISTFHFSTHEKYVSIEMPNVEAPQPSPRTASPAVAAPANTGATEGLEYEIQRLKEENSSMKRKHDKEVEKIKQV